MTEAKQAEPPSWRRPPLFMIGRDDHRNWVVQDLKGICGGLFVSREAALGYIRSENGQRQSAVVMVSGVLELDMTSKSSTSVRHARTGNSEPLRRIA